MRDYIVIQGGCRLEGVVQVGGAKNSALPLLMATLLTPEECILTNVPNLDDIGVTGRLLKALGAEFEYSDNTVRVRASTITTSQAPHSLVKAMRASFWVLGPLLARCGTASVALPGGDAIGARPVDLHLKGLVRFGADVKMNHGVVTVNALSGLKPAMIDLDFPSVGATHCLLMTAALIPGESVISGAAREPEIQQLAEFLSLMGAEIEGAGTARIVVRGKRELGGANIRIIGDRIEATTYLAAAAVTGGDLTVTGIEPAHLSGVVEFLEGAGVKLELLPGAVRARLSSDLKATSFTTAPFPGVATDVQPLLMAMLTRATGRSEVTETIFESRFGHVAEYRRFGAQISISGKTATVDGVPRLNGISCEAGDIRAAAGLVLMGLQADGITEVHDIHHLDRGYEGMAEKLSAVGGTISRVPSFDSRELVMGC